DGERGEQVPDAAPRGRRQAAAAHHGVGEQHIDRVSAGGGDDDSRGDQGIDVEGGHLGRALCLWRLSFEAVRTLAIALGVLRSAGLCCIATSAALLYMR